MAGTVEKGVRDGHPEEVLPPDFCRFKEYFLHSLNKQSVRKLRPRVGELGGLSERQSVRWGAWLQHLTYAYKYLPGYM